jgi:hypothetical protein
MVLITLGWFTEHGQPFDAQATGFHARLRHFVDSRVPESWRREVVEGRGWGMFGAAASPGGWNWNLVSRDQDVLVATVGLPVGLDDTALSGGPIGVGRGLLAGRSMLDGVVPPFAMLATDGGRVAAQQDWFGMASIYVYRSHGVVAFSNRPILLPYVFGDAIRPDTEGFARYAARDASVGGSSPVTGVKPLGPGEAFVGIRNPNNTWKISVSQGTCLTTPQWPEPGARQPSRLPAPRPSWAWARRIPHSGAQPPRRAARRLSSSTSSRYRIVVRTTPRIAANSNPEWQLAGTAGLLLTAMHREGRRHDAGRMTRRIPPALVLVFLAPFVGEMLLGNTPLRLILGYFLVLPMYGFGALFIRELSRRTGRGWPTILILGVAYGVVEEGLADMSLFNPNFLGQQLLSYGNLFNIGWPWWCFVLTLHAVWSIGVSIALAEALFARRGPYPWLGRTGLVVSGVGFVFGVVLIHFVGGQGYQLSVGQVALSLVLVALISAVAFLVPVRRGTHTRDPRRAPNPWLVGGTAFVLTSAFMAVTRLSYGLKLPADLLILIYVVLYGLAAWAVWHWSRRIDWGAQHVFSLAAGALLTYAWYGFVQAPHDALDMIGQAIFALLALGVIILASRQVRTDKSELGSGRMPDVAGSPVSEDASHRLPLQS